MASPAGRLAISAPGGPAVGGATAMPGRTRFRTKAATRWALRQLGHTVKVLGRQGPPVGFAEVGGRLVQRQAGDPVAVGGHVGEGDGAARGVAIEVEAREALLGREAIEPLDLRGQVVGSRGPLASVDFQVFRGHSRPSVRARRAGAHSVRARVKGCLAEKWLRSSVCSTLRAQQYAVGRQPWGRRTRRSRPGRCAFERSLERYRVPCGEPWTPRESLQPTTYSIYSTRELNYLGFSRTVARTEENARPTWTEA